MKGVPYCLECLQNGDPSLKVADHPKFGKILVAARDLPKGYLAAWWGDLLPGGCFFIAWAPPLPVTG